MQLAWTHDMNDHWTSSACITISTTSYNKHILWRVCGKTAFVSLLPQEESSEGTATLHHVGNCLLVNMAHHPRRPGSTATPLWEPHVWTDSCYVMQTTSWPIDYQYSILAPWSVQLRWNGKSLPLSQFAWYQMHMYILPPLTETSWRHPLLLGVWKPFPVILLSYGHQNPARQNKLLHITSRNTD